MVAVKIFLSIGIILPLSGTILSVGHNDLFTVTQYNIIYNSIFFS